MGPLTGHFDSDLTFLRDLCHSWGHMCGFKCQVSWFKPIQNTNIAQRSVTPSINHAEVMIILNLK